MSQHYDVIIIGAGPAGLGCAVALQRCGVTNMLILDKKEVGASFAAWPKQMRLLTPSFHSNPFGQVDLNAVTPNTSPADCLHTQHPSGGQYARYLQALVTHFKLPVQTGVTVKQVRTMTDEFLVETNKTSYTAWYVIWAAGEFATPDTGGIRGADLCLHNSKVRDWADLEGDKFTLIGGYESGIDAAIHLAWQGKAVHLLSRGEPWGTHDADPSRTLSPHTRDRLKEALQEAPGSIRFSKNADIVAVKKSRLGYEIIDNEGAPYLSPTAPILCTGFHNSLKQIRPLFAWKNNQPVFSEKADESTITPGLFYSGPSLQHRGMLFCFIYKYRARFGIVAREIAERLGHEWREPLKLWQERGFMLEDLSCCTDCKCAVEPENADNPEVEDFADTL